jgi:hypothetical protein
VFYPGAFAGYLRERGYPHTQFAISCGKWDPHLGMECLPTNSNFGTLTMSRYGKSPVGLNLSQILVLNM